MTREEAIKYLEQHKYANTCEQKSLEESNEAIDMAIEALETETIRCGECENYIDGRCIEANHHVAAHGNCMGVFGAKRREL